MVSFKNLIKLAFQIFSVARTLPQSLPKRSPLVPVTQYRSAYESKTKTVVRLVIRPLCDHQRAGPGGLGQVEMPGYPQSSLEEREESRYGQS